MHRRATLEVLVNRTGSAQREFCFMEILPVLRVITFIICVCAASVVCAVASQQAAPETKDVPAVLRFTMKDIDGKDVDLSTYRGKVIVIVNTASKCGYTPQYEELQALYTKYREQGLVVLGFPANEFGNQEPGTNEDIKAFCSDKYSVTFPMFSKVVVKGEGISPLYTHLTSNDTNPKSAGDIRWNFTKFLISREGEVTARFEPKVKPMSEEMTRAVEAELARN